MPIFEYLCQCGKWREIITTSHTPADSLPCECGSRSELKISAPAFIKFKGPGFHCNDYGKVPLHKLPPEEADPRETKI